MSKPEKKLFLLDAYALIYRAHFAFSKSPRISSKGVNTGVMFGFLNTLLEVLQKQKPTHIAVAFDTAAPTFRHEQFAEYKATRQAAPEDIRTGIPVVKEIVRAFNIPVIECDGFEADDVIGTLAKQAGRQGFEVFMMTPDKDFGQLVEDHVYLYKPAYMGNAVDVLGIPEVLEKWGINRVDQVTDMLGLQGDASDNIPGIPGIGPKTASKLIHEFGTVENLVENVDKLKGKLKENVEMYGQQGILSKELATINVEVPIEFNEKALLHGEPDEEKVRQICEEYEFRTILKRIFGEQATAKTTATVSGQMSMFSGESQVAVEVSEPVTVPKNNIKSVETDYHLIDSPEKRKELIHFLQLQKEFCFDTEVTDLDAVEAKIVALAFSYVKGEAYYIPVPQNMKEATKILQEFRGVFENPDILKIGQNLKYDILALKKYGINVKGSIFDTMLAHYVIEPETQHNMDVMAEQYLNYIPLAINAVRGSRGRRYKNMKDLSLQDIILSAGEDADITFQLKEELSNQIKKDGLSKLLNEVEHPLVYVLADMEFAGVRVDQHALEQMSSGLLESTLQLQKEIFEIAGCEFNIGSPKQLGEVLFEQLKLIEKPKKTKTGQYATGEEILSRLAAEHEIARKILEFREYQKLKSTYVDALPKMISPGDGRVHTDYGQAVAATGRLSSNNPNLQNIPIRTEKGREIRKAFVPRDDNHLLLSADYSQIELRIVASFAKDEEMIQAFRNGRDIHATTAAKVFGVPVDSVDPNMRRKAKEVNFGIIYGISAFGLSQSLRIPRAEANDIINAYFKEFPSIKRYMDNSINTAREQGYVETILGRRRYLRDVNSRNATMRGYAERNAINAPIQGSAADIIKVAMVNIHKWLEDEKLGTKMILQVHDELIFDVPKNEVDVVRENIIRLMKSAVDLEVPMEVEAGVGENWLLAH